MFRVSAGRDVQVGFIPQDSGSLHSIVLVVLREFLQSVEGLLIDEEPLLDPAFDSGGGADASEALLAVQHFDALSIFHVADAIEDGRHLIAQRGLRRGDIGHVQYPMASAPTCRKHEKGGQRDCGKSASQREMSAALSRLNSRRDGNFLL